MPSSRREFVRLCTLAAASIGLGPLAAQRFVEAAAKGLRPSVIWLQFQECTGCTESLLRTSHPAVDDLIFDLISLDYHETLFAAAGHQAEAALKTGDARPTPASTCASSRARSRPRRTGSTARSAAVRRSTSCSDVAAQAGAVIAIGSCASWGGIPSADPNPTGAVGAHEVLKGKTVVNIPGCPANPYNFLGTVLQYATYGTLPALDAEGRPKFAYGQTIHEHCPRRAHFDAGRFAEKFGDEGHRQRLLPLQARMQGAGDLRQLLGRSISATWTARGRSASGIPASAAPSRRSRSACRSTRPSTSSGRCRPTPTRRFTRAQGGVSPVATAVGRRHRRRARAARASWRRRSSQRRSSRKRQRRPARRRSAGGVAMGITRRAAL